jgi:hypothetical protein
MRVPSDDKFGHAQGYTELDASTRVGGGGGGGVGIGGGNLFGGGVTAGGEDVRGVRADPEGVRRVATALGGGGGAGPACLDKDTLAAVLRSQTKEGGVTPDEAVAGW